MNRADNPLKETALGTPAEYTSLINPMLLGARSWLVHNADKKPFYVDGGPRSGKLDGPRDLKRLATFDAACEALALKPEGWGLGVAINHGFQFLDLDKCRNAATGEAAPWAAAVLKQAVKLEAYVEVSRSGTGFHVIGHGVELPTIKRRGVELYLHGRYCAMGTVTYTGAVPLPDLTPLLPLLLARAGVKPDGTPKLRLVGKPAAVPFKPLTWVDDQHQAARALEALDPSMSYPDWIRVGMALHHASGGDDSGMVLWRDWSKCSDTKFKPGDCLYHWSGFKADGGVTLGTLLHMAEEARSMRMDDAQAPLPTSGIPERRREFDDDELLSVEHPPIPWVVESLIAPGLTLLAAPPKMGKSYFVLQMAICVGAGRPFLGMATTQSRVSYFDLEEWEELLQRRRKLIGAGNGITQTSVRYAMEMSGGDITVLHDIQRHIDGGSKLVILDLLARVRDELNEDSKKNAYARDYHVLRKFADFILQRNPGVALVIVHHTNKGNHEDWQSKISGSQGLAGATHTNMVLTHTDLRGLDTEAKREALKYRALHVAGKLVEPADYMLKMMESGGGWEISSKTDEEVKTFGKHAHILSVLRETPGEWVTAKQVADIVDGTLAAVKKMMARMAQKGEIESSGSGGAGYRVRG